MDVEHVEEVNKAPVGHEGQPMLLQMSTATNLRIKVSTSVTFIARFHFNSPGFETALLFDPIFGI